MNTQKECELANDYELYCIDDLPILVGDPIISQKDKNYPEKIYSFGSGKPTGDNKILKFSMPLTYSGETTIDDAIYDLFLFPENAFDGKDLWNCGKSFYLMLEVIDDIEPTKWFLLLPKSNSVKTVKKEFNDFILKSEE